MFKKLLAGATTLALALGMVALTAETASAHSNNVTGAVSCNTGDPTNPWKVTWTITNDWDSPATIDSTSETAPYTSPVVIPTVVAKSSSNPHSVTFSQVFSAIPAGNVKLTIHSTWSDYNQSNDDTITAAEFKTNCLPDDTDTKVNICHYDNGQGGKYTLNNVSYSSIITGPNGHDSHANDIIPPFTYVKQGINGSYPGKNWDAYHQWVWGNGCSTDTTPTKPTIVQAVCTAAGQVGLAKYTVPASDYVKYQTSSTQNGTYTDVTAGDHFVADGTSIWIQAVALPGYTLTGNDSQYKWKLDFTDVDQSKCVVPPPPTFTPAQCTGPGTSSNATYTVPQNVNGITYTVYVNGVINNSAGASNSVTTFPTTVRIVASVQGGYTIVPGSQMNWPGPGANDVYTFTSAGDCIVTATPGDVTPTYPQCTSTNPGVPGQSGYTIPASTPVGSVVYTVTIDGLVKDSTYGTTGFHAVPYGSVVSISASAAPGYTLAAGTSTWGPWTFTATDPVDCVYSATPGDVIPTYPQCTSDEPGVPSESGYTIGTSSPSGSVIYTVKFDGVTQDSSFGTTGFHPVPYGTVVVITAAPAAGYTFDALKLQTEWNFTFTTDDPLDCIYPQPVDPAIGHTELCTELDSGLGVYTSGYITIPAHPSFVHYYIDGSATESLAGNHDASYGDHSIKVELDAGSGYYLTGYDGPYTVFVDQAEKCGLTTLPVVDPLVTFHQQTCSAAGTYTLDADPTELFDGIIWTVTGPSGALPTSQGEHTAPTGTVHVMAVPDSANHFGFATADNPFVTEYTFAVPADCLPTLAFTGGGIATGALGISALLVLGGGLLVAARNRKVGMVKADN